MRFTSARDLHTEQGCIGRLRLALQSLCWSNTLLLCHISYLKMLTTSGQMESSSDLRRTHAELGLHHSTNAKLDYKYRESSIISYFYTNIHAREHSWALGISCVIPEQPQLFLARAHQQSPKRFLTKAHELSGVRSPSQFSLPTGKYPALENKRCVRTHTTEPIELSDRDLSQAW